jgi:hypothetical protein
MDAANRIPRVSLLRPLRVDPLRQSQTRSDDTADRPVVASLPVLAGRDARDERRAPVFHAAPFVAHLLAGYGSPDGDRRRRSMADGMAARANARYLAVRGASDGIAPGFLAERLV